MSVIPESAPQALLGPATSVTAPELIPSPVAKRALDVIGALALLVLLAPVMLALACLVASDGGPVLYRHVRVGRDGTRFYCLKFRTMHPDAASLLHALLERDPEARRQWLATHKVKDDPRITWAGRFLRRSSLDELPQLWNVLRGDMSLVGPRPIVGEEVARYGRHIATYYRIRPGLTGLWQVSGRNDVSYKQRVAMDVCYVRRWSLTLDFLILLKTVRVVLSFDGAY